MELSRYNDFTKIIEKISKVYGRSLSPDVLDLWIECLKPFAFEAVKDAMGQFVQTESRMPVPADILKILQGALQDRALSALIKVETAVLRHGAYATVVFDDPAIHAVISGLGGWIRLCGLTDAEWVWWRKDFRERYILLARTGLADVESPGFLPGIFELGNIEAGYPPGPPAMIGDRKKCLRLFGAGIRDERVSSLLKSAAETGALKEIPR